MSAEIRKLLIHCEDLSVGFHQACANNGQTPCVDYPFTGCPASVCVSNRKLLEEFKAALLPKDPR